MNGAADFAPDAKAVPLGATVGADIAADAEGNIFYTPGNIIIKITPQGSMEVFAGGGNSSDPNAPADEIEFRLPFGIDVSADGKVYVADPTSGNIRIIYTNGSSQLIAGRITGGQSRNDPDGVEAIGSRMRPFNVKVDGKGIVYFTDIHNIGGLRLRKINRSGVLETIFGGGDSQIADGVSGGNADSGVFDTASSDPVIYPDGTILLSFFNLKQIWQLQPLFRPSEDGLVDYFIPSMDGDEILRFDNFGKHLETYFAKTGQLKYRMNYDGETLLSIQDSYGLTTEFLRDGSGNLSGIRSPYGEETVIGLNGDGYIESVSNPKGETWRLGYKDADGLLTSFQKPKTNSTFFEYDDLGLLTKESNNRGLRFDIRLNYPDSSDRFKTDIIVTTGEGKETIYGRTYINYSAGRSERLIHNEGTVFVDETIDAQVRDNVDGSVEVTKFTADPRLGIGAAYVSTSSVTLRSGLSRSVQRSRSVQLSDSSDIFSLVSESNVTEVNGRTYLDNYNALSRIMSSTSPEGRVSSTSYDVFEKPILIQEPGVFAVSLSYDSLGRLQNVGQGNRGSTFEYNSKGRVQKVTDSLGRERIYGYDDAGRVISETLEDLRVIAYSYDLNGNLESITPPGRPSHNFLYDLLDQESNYLPPLLGGTQSTPTKRFYNLDKQLTSVERPDGRIITYNYDSVASKLSSINTSEGNYGFTYFPGQRPRQITSPYGQVTDLVWDSSLLISEASSGVVVGTVSYQYNNDFLPSTVIINETPAFGFSYDNDLLLTNAGDEVITRDPVSGFATKTQIDSISEDWTYNNFGEIESMTSVALDYSLSRDALGRIISKTETDLSGQTHVYGYDYDLAGRLKSVTKDGSLVDFYDYDQNSNRTTVNGQVIAGYDEQDRLVFWNQNTYTYNLNGELESKSNSQSGDTTTYLYDSFGNLASVNLPSGDVIEYVIDGRDRRVSKKVNGTKVRSYLYLDQLNPVAELNPDDTIKSIFVYSVKSNVPSYMIRGGNKYRIISDERGSVRYVVNTSTNMVTQEMEYDVWGKVTKDTNPGFQPFGFAGGIYDHQTGLVRFGARDYDAETGRWTSKDPILFNGDGFNLYGYVENDPVNFIDENGLQKSNCIGEFCGGGGSGVDIESIIDSANKERRRRNNLCKSNPGLPQCKKKRQQERDRQNRENKNRDNGGVGPGRRAGTGGGSCG